MIVGLAPNAELALWSCAKIMESLLGFYTSTSEEYTSRRVEEARQGGKPQTLALVSGCLGLWVPGFWRFGL